MKYLYVSSEGEISQQEFENESGLKNDLASVDSQDLEIIRFVRGRFERAAVDSEEDDEGKLAYSVDSWDPI